MGKNPRKNVQKKRKTAVRDKVRRKKSAELSTRWIRSIVSGARAEAERLIKLRRMEILN